MITNKKFVSRVVNGVRAITKDEHISKRYILSIGINKSKTYIAQKLTDKSLFRESNIFKTIKCFEMAKDDVLKCDILEFRRCKTLMKSKEKLPEIVTSKYGEAILSVTSIDDGTEFFYSPFVDNNINNKREFSNLIKKYYIRNNYLYIPNYLVYGLNLDVLAINTKEINDVSGCSENSVCKSIWDYEFVCPDKLIEPIIQETIQEVASYFKRMVVDENPNLDSNQKSQLIK